VTALQNLIWMTHLTPGVNYSICMCGMLSNLLYSLFFTKVFHDINMVLKLNYSCVYFPVIFVIFISSFPALVYHSLQVFLINKEIDNTNS